MTKRAAAAPDPAVDHLERSSPLDAQQLAALAASPAPEPPAAEAPRRRWIEQVEQAVRKNAEVLASIGRFRDPAFTFARELRRFLEWAELSPDEAADRAEACFLALAEANRRSLDGRDDRLPFRRLPAEQIAWVTAHCHESNEGGWVAALGIEDRWGRGRHDPLQAFLSDWRGITSRPGALDVAFDGADGSGCYADPAFFGRHLAAPRRWKVRRFLAACRELSQLFSDGVFFMPQSVSAGRLETDPGNISRWRKEAVAWGAAGEGRRRDEPRRPGGEGREVQVDRPVSSTPLYSPVVLGQGESSSTTRRSGRHRLP